MSEPVAFSRSLYEPDAIRAAIDAFADLARFELDDQGEDIVVRIAEADSEIAHLADEFANYALVETVTRRAAGQGSTR